MKTIFDIDEITARYAYSDFAKTTGMSFSNFIKDITPLQEQTLYTEEGMQVIERLSAEHLSYYLDRLSPTESLKLNEISSNYMLFYTRPSSPKQMIGVLLRIKDGYVGAMCEEFMPYARHGNNILLDVLSCIVKNERREKIAYEMMESLRKRLAVPVPTMECECKQSQLHS
jgi:hypothetical protein